MLGQYSVSGNGILAAASAGDLYRTVSIVSPEGENISTAGKPDAYSTLRLSPDGRSVALGKNMPDATFEIWLMDLAHGSPVPLTNNAGISFHPVWSPRGDEILYSVFRDGRYRMYRKPVSGSGSEELVQSSDTSQLAGDWMPNPPRIVYWDRSTGSINLNPAIQPRTTRFSRLLSIISNCCAAHHPGDNRFPHKWLRLMVVASFRAGNCRI